MSIFWNESCDLNHNQVLKKLREKNLTKIREQVYQVFLLFWHLRL